ncbi:MULTISPECIES: STAS domain-containing protein [Nostocales]|uniref:STAS domain-containing protein n=3 Tax=Nostocales TaxID=1161 RepID=A0A8S9TC45_9CYAN|nr:STAS domain-containing protein [Tolypothrix bouteillei]KAF3889003.1 STAS domain-containing protein [Tolypothrix bouteillei VB521301]
MLLIDYPKIAVIRPQGSLSGSKALELDKDLRTTLVKEDISVLLLDLQYVESLDCSGLMALVSALKLAQTKRKRFSLCCVPAPLRMIFELTQLDTVFEMFDCEAEFEATCESVREAEFEATCESVGEPALLCA